MYELAGSPAGQRRLERHFRTFITEADFRWLKKHDIDIVRIPVGYWLFDGDEPYPPNVARLDWAMKMAEKYGLRVLIDLHAAKGSQNGEAHSGRRGAYTWSQRQEYQQQTIETLRRIALRYADNSMLWGIELVNEPRLGWSYFKLLRFYRRAYRELQNVLRPGVYTVFHDAFHPLLFTGSLTARKDYPIAMDVHWYALAPRVFGRLSLGQYGRVQQLYYGALLWTIQRWQPAIVGEWSSVLPQAMFDRTPPSRHYDLLGRNVVAQQVLYRPALATMYWNYKADGVGMYHFRSLVESGTIATK